MTVNSKENFLVPVLGTQVKVGIVFVVTAVVVQTRRLGMVGRRVLGEEQEDK